MKSSSGEQNKNCPFAINRSVMGIKKQRFYENIKGIYLKLRKFQKLIVLLDVSTYAAGAAFFLFLSLIPMIMIVSGVLPYSEILQKDVVTISQAVIPEKVYRFLIEIAKNYSGSSMTLVSFSALVTIWSASKGILSMIRGLNHVYRIEESRNYFMLRLKAMVYTLFLMFAIMLAMFLVVSGNSMPETGNIGRMLSPVRHLLVACMMSVMFCTLYCLLPNNRLAWTLHFPGAVFTAVFWTLYSFLFSVYIDYMGGFSMYGSLTTVVIVLIWLYFCMYIFFCGALINRFVNHIFSK